jgi:hypothetical protein
MTELLDMFRETVAQHLAHTATWIPVAMAGALALLALVLLVKGGRLVPLLAGLALAGLGMAGGPFLVRLVGTPLWATLAVAGVCGLLLGLLLFRVWLAFAVAGVFALAGLSLYTVKTISPHLRGYSSWGLAQETPGSDVLYAVTIPDAAAAQSASNLPAAGAARLWAYLLAVVPGFRTSLVAITLSTGLAGLIFGILLPRVARAFLGATLGTLLLLQAVGLVVNTVWTAGLQYLQVVGLHGWLTAVGGVWLASLLANLYDLRTRSAERPAEPEGETEGQVATA